MLTARAQPQSSQG